MSPWHSSICDFKGNEDFKFLKGNNRFFRFMNCQEGLPRIYDSFRQRQSGENGNRNIIVLVFDELASYCNSLDKIQLKKKKKVI